MESCKRNKDVDFIFFTDNDIDPSFKNCNIKLIYFSIENYNNLASDKLGLKIAVENGYKICDFRPAFGKIFEDYITDYEFWGYADIDLIFGNIRSFYTDKVLKNHDYFSAKSEYPSGFFSLYRNIPKLNTLFLKSRDYKQIFLTKDNMLFEECGGYYSEVISGINILDTKCGYDTLFHVLQKHKHEVRALFEFYTLCGTPGNITIDNNLLIYNNEFEVLLYHLSDYKKNVFSTKRNWQNIPALYKINKHTFVKTGLISRLCFLYFEHLKPSVTWYLIKIQSKTNLFKNKYQDKLDGNYTYMQQNIAIKTINQKTGLILNGLFIALQATYKKNLFYLKEFDSLLLFENQSVIKWIKRDGNVIDYVKD